MHADRTELQSPASESKPPQHLEDITTAFILDNFSEHGMDIYNLMSNCKTEDNILDLTLHLMNTYKDVLNDSASIRQTELIVVSASEDAQLIKSHIASKLESKYPERKQPNREWGEARMATDDDHYYVIEGFVKGEPVKFQTLNRNHLTEGNPSVTKITEHSLKGQIKVTNEKGTVFYINEEPGPLIDALTILDNLVKQ